MRRIAPILLFLAALTTACAKSAPEVEPVPEVVGARIADNLEAPIARGDCREAVRRAVARPDLDVEKVPAPVAMTPGPIDVKRMPKGAADRNGYYHVKFHVLVDTLGKPDMRTFIVDTTTHPWFGTSVKAAVAKWTFAPAEIAGCRVPRNYSLGITPRGKSPATPAKATTKTAPAKPPATKKPPV